MVKVLLADNFYPEGDAQAYANAVRFLRFEPMEYGEEIKNFNMIFPGVDDVLSKVLGEPVVVDVERSGTFRKPMICVVRFESFENLDEWCFVAALEKTTFNLYHHLKEGVGEAGVVDARSALDGYQNFNYRNFFEWNIDVNIVLQPNQGVFFRPWMFHSFEDGIVQYYRLKSKKE